MAGLVPNFTDETAWVTGTLATLGDGVVTFNGGGTPPNRVTTTTNYFWDSGRPYLIRVDVLPGFSINTMSSPNQLRVEVDGQVLTVGISNFPNGGGPIYFPFIGQGNFTIINIRSQLIFNSAIKNIFVELKQQIPKVNLEGDVLLFNTVDDGEINISGGVVEMTGDFRTAVYLSMFGGNREDDGRPENKFMWWGNFSENDPDFKYRSETQYLLASLPLTSGNLKLVQDAARRDLQWMLNKQIVSSIEAEAFIPSVNKITIRVRGIAEGEEFLFNFTENWKASVAQ